MCFSVGKGLWVCGCGCNPFKVLPWLPWSTLILCRCYRDDTAKVEDLS